MKRLTYLALILSAIGGCGKQATKRPAWQVTATVQTAGTFDVTNARTGSTTADVPLIGAAIVRVRATNLDPAHFVELPPVRVTDEHGNRYREEDIGPDREPAGKLADRRVRPGESVEDVLLIEPPARSASTLIVEVGGVSVRVPRADWK